MFLNWKKQNCENELTLQQKRVLRGQALNGDLDGARRGLEKLERGDDG